MSARSLSTWAREDRPIGPRGRPPTSAKRREEASDRVLQAWEAQGQSGGVRTIRAALANSVSWSLIRGSLGAIKRSRRARTNAHDAEHRMHVEVNVRDAMWSMDATHLGRLQGGEAVEAQVVRETSTPKILSVDVGPPADGDDVVRILARVAEERGGLPLVLVTDNGPIYVCDTVEAWLAEHGVTHLLSLPHTPRHNPWVERTNGELKAETGLGRGVVLNDDAQAREQLADARCRLDDVRLRASLGFRTATAADAGLTPWYHVCPRDRFLATVRRRLDEALPGLEKARELRKAWREAIYAAMEELGLIKRTRGGR